MLRTFFIYEERAMKEHLHRSNYQSVLLEIEMPIQGSGTVLTSAFKNRFSTVNTYIVSIQYTGNILL
jgi:hypothetical protein